MARHAVNISHYVCRSLMLLEGTRLCGTMMDFFVIYVNIFRLFHSFTVCMFYNITVNTHDFTLYLIQT